MDNSEQKLKTAEAVLELNSLFNDLNNFKEVPVVLETILKNISHWTGLPCIKFQQVTLLQQLRTNPFHLTGKNFIKALHPMIITEKQFLN